MRIKCPSCFAEFDLGSALDSEAGRDLMRILADLDPGLSRPLVTYLSLFRSKSRALSWDRALRLAREAQALEPERARLAAGLTKVVDVLREKQRFDGWKPLTNHNYLKRVLEGLTPSDYETNQVRVLPQEQQKPQFKSKTAAAYLALEKMNY